MDHNNHTLRYYRSSWLRVFELYANIFRLLICLQGSVMQTKTHQQANF